MYRYNDGDDGELISEDPIFYMSSLDQAKKGTLNRTKDRQNNGTRVWTRVLHVDLGLYKHPRTEKHNSCK